MKLANLIFITLLIDVISFDEKHTKLTSVAVAAVAVATATSRHNSVFIKINTIKHGYDVTFFISSIRLCSNIQKNWILEHSPFWFKHQFVPLTARRYIWVQWLNNFLLDFSMKWLQIRRKINFPLNRSKLFRNFENYSKFPVCLILRKHLPSVCHSSTGHNGYWFPNGYALVEILLVYIWTWLQFVNQVF